MPNENTKPLLNIVVLGASFAGLSVAHYFLDETLSKINRNSSKARYRLIVISPSRHIYWNIAAPRVLVGPGLCKEEDIFVPIEPGFQRHKGKDFTLIQGLVSTWDKEARTVQVEVIGAKAHARAMNIAGKQKNDSQQHMTFMIPYHALIIATGTSAHSDLLSLHGPHVKTLEALQRHHCKVERASSVIVAGGGPSGVETAGQLATYLNHYPSKLPPSFAHETAREITLIMASDRALPQLPEAMGRKAEKQLQGLGVTIIKGVRVVDAVEDDNTRRAVAVTLSDHTIMRADVYIAATGVSPNTAFAPAEVLDDTGYIITGQDLHSSGAALMDGEGPADTKQTLRVTMGGERVYAVGDCASYSANYVLDAYIGVTPLLKNLEKDIWAWELRQANPYGGAEDEIQAREDVMLVRPSKIESQLCPIVRRGGVGILFGHAVPSFMVHLAKGRDYRVGKAGKVVADGDNPY